MKKVALYLAIAALAAGCASKEARQDAPVTDRSTGATPSTAATSPGSTATPSSTARVEGNPLRDPSSILSKRSVYFDYDSNAVKDEYRGLVQAHSRYLTDKRDARIRIEGNADERGSREYNLALGQKRADAVKQMMVLLGAPASQIETVSFGEEKPRAQGSTEQAFAENRRADIVHQGE